MILARLFIIFQNFKDKKIFFQDKKRNIEMTDEIKLKNNANDFLVNIDTKFNHWVIDVRAELEFKGANSFCDSITVENVSREFHERIKISGCKRIFK